MVEEVRVSLERIDGRNRDAAVRLEVAEEHLAYVSPVAEMLADGEGDESIEPYAICAGGEIVGFFKLDFDRERVSRYADGESPCGLRGYLICNRHQGRGYGRTAIPLIRRLLREDYPGAERLYLTVNCRNAPAISTYLRSGFEDTGRLYHGGNSGPQHVFCMEIRQKTLTTITTIIATKRCRHY